MDDAINIPPIGFRWQDSRRDSPKHRGTEGKRRERDARERRFEMEDRAPPRNHVYEKRIGQEILGPEDRKERGRDRKRRKSATLSGADKDRRHSPSPRRFPPYKCRRDVHDGSRKKNIEDGSGRGLANDNRLEGFDEADLFLSGRIQGRSGFNCAKLQGVSIEPYPTISYDDSSASRKRDLLSYKQFILELEDDISPGDAKRRYEAHKKECIITLKQAFFKEHKDDDWLREKYDPVRLEAVLARRNERAKVIANELMSALQAGFLESGLNMETPTKEEPESDLGCGGKKRKFLRLHSKPQKNNAVPTECSGCSEPRRVIVDTKLARSLIQKLDAEKGIGDNILLADKNSEGDVDLGSTGTKSFFKQVKYLEDIDLSKVMRTYLWRVHFLDYYGMVEYKEQPKKLRRTKSPTSEGTGGFNVDLEESRLAEWEERLETTWQARLQTGDLIELMLGKESLETTASEALDPFVRKIRDEKYGWKYGCNAKGCTKLFHGPEFVHKHLKLKHPNLITDAIVKAREELYFQNYMRDVDASGFDQITSIHPQQNSSDKSREDCGPSIFGPSNDETVNHKILDKQPPSTEVHRPRDTKFTPRTNEVFEKCSRVGEDEQLKRGGHEKSQFDRVTSEHSSSPRVFLPLETTRPTLCGGGFLRSCFERVQMEPLVFNHFSGSPMHGLLGGLFVPDVLGPPQVLMPVPGAGPLGPFVPAPPGIAMRFLIDSSVPSHCGFKQSFVDDNNRRPSDRNRPTPCPRLGGGLSDIPSATIPSHGGHHDPRGIRSYHDLDTPGDEITVIDYRTS